MVTAWLFICAYVVGSFPVGYIIARLKGIKNIRAHGSGNIGATNVARVLGKQYFALTMLIDAGKAYLFLYLTHTAVHGTYQVYLLAATLLVANGWSLFLRGSGGKGVSTAVGLLLYLSPVVVPLLFAVWLIIFCITRTVGVSSALAVLFLPLHSFAYTSCMSHTYFSLFVSCWIVFRHTTNIRNYFYKKGTQ